MMKKIVYERLIVDVEWHEDDVVRTSEESFFGSLVDGKDDSQKGWWGNE